MFSILLEHDQHAPADEPHVSAAKRLLALLKKQDDEGHLKSNSNLSTG